MRKLRELERIRPAANTFLLPWPRRSAPTLTPAMRRRGEGEGSGWQAPVPCGVMRPSGEPPSTPAGQLSPSGAC